LSYAAQGLRVIPLHTPKGDGCSCQDVECHSIGKHPRLGKWVELASKDASTIERWWKKFPDANIGIATGAESGVFVVDVDGEEGEITLSSLQQRRFTELPETRECQTGKGRHLYFRHSGGKLPNRASTLGKGLDIRGDGGQAVAPPSVHHSGIPYMWTNRDEDLRRSTPVAH
jgi:hypothetical protein